MKKYALLFALSLAVLSVLSACSPKSAEPTVAPAASQPGAIIAEGSLLPVNWLDQSFSIPGQVAEVLVKDGDSVQTGQVIARLKDSPEARTALARAQQEAVAAQQALDNLKEAAEVNLAQKRLDVITAEKQLDEAQERYDSDKTDQNRALIDVAKAALQHAEDVNAQIKAGGGVDPDVMAAAEARLASANAALASAQAALDALELKATLDGVLVDVNVQPGQRVTAGQPLMTVADFSTWVIKTDNLTEAEVVRVKTGQKVEVSLDALPDVTLGGEVSRINARFEEKRGDITYTVTVTMSQTDPQMRWGMTAAVKFLP